MRSTLAWSLAVTSLLSGCMLGPKNGPSYREVGQTFIEADKTLTEEGDDLADFWQQFDDPLLIELIHTCIEKNFDINLAREKVKELRASYHMQSADLWPSVNAFGSAIRFKKPTNVFGVPLPPPSVQNLYVLGFDASWEIDFFGKVRSAKKAAYLEVLSQEENVYSTQVTLVAELARLYTDIRAHQQRIYVLKKKIAAQQKLTALSQVMTLSGLSSEVNLQNEMASLAQNESLLPQLQKEMKDSLYQLCFILGLYPKDVQSYFTKRKPIPFAQNKVPIGLPSDLLRRRPDIRAAEKSYFAASARIGSAKADLFPSISLTGAWSGISSEVSSLFSKASQVWLIWPQINWNIFQGWKTLANIKVQKSKQKQALLSYEKSIAQALSDVESALSGYAEDSLSLHAYKEQVRAKNVVHELSAALLSCGLKQEQDSLLAEKDFYDAQDMYFQGKQRAMASLIALYKAVGGGWQLSYPASEETSFNTEEKK